MRFFHIEIRKTYICCEKLFIGSYIDLYAHKSVHKLKQTGRYETFKT